MKVAVVGGGLFGCTAAIFAARAGHEVHLFEEKPALLQGASSINQFRLHRGYHYPRSPETALECRAGLRAFREEYGSAVIEGGRHLYAIANEGSRVSGDDYLRFCDDNDLPFEVIDAGALIQNTHLVIAAEEPRLDLEELRRLVCRKLGAAAVRVHLETPATRELRDEFDRIVIAAYAGTNRVAAEFSARQDGFQFEVCEKPVLRMPEEFGRTSIVVMDGEFASIDPLGQTGLFVLGHVKYAIHHANVGLVPEIPPALVPCLDRGIVKNPITTRANLMVAAAAHHVPMLWDAIHYGSMFTVRAVLAGVDETDARPTLVRELDDQVIREFSGKLPTAVSAAQSVVTILDRKGDRARSAA